MTPISGYNLKQQDSDSTNAHESKARIAKIIETDEPLAKIDATNKTKSNAQVSNAPQMVKTELSATTEWSSQQNETLSEKSSSSIGSIEQRLAEMTSPVRTAAEVHAERNGNYQYKLDNCN